MKAEELLEAARKALGEFQLCDSCLGRLFGMLGYGLTNRERGRALKTLLLMLSYDALSGKADVEALQRLAASGFKPAREALAKVGAKTLSGNQCYLCNGIMERLEELAKLCIEAGREYEYDTFQVGCSLPTQMVKREEELWLKLGIVSAESIKSELTREVGKIISSIVNKTYSLKNPDIIFVVNVAEWKVSVQSKPLYIYGRYRKLARGLPQSPWLQKPDPRVLYPFSIEELITKPLLRLAQGEEAKLHAAGREDLDVRTLGSGRPFIAEIRSPRVRRIDLKEAERVINEEAKGLVEVEGLQFVDGKLVPKLKAYAEIARKVYLAKVRVGRSLSEEDLRTLEERLRGAVVLQRTPLRILGRKVDKVRRKVVYDVEARLLDSDTLQLKIVCQGGLYVKELIHGDQGRTKPSVAEVLGAQVEVEELDVVYIEEPAIVQQYLRPAG